MLLLFSPANKILYPAAGAELDPHLSLGMASAVTIM